MPLLPDADCIVLRSKHRSFMDSATFFKREACWSCASRTILDSRLRLVKTFPCFGEFEPRSLTTAFVG